MAQTNTDCRFRSLRRFLAMARLAVCRRGLNCRRAASEFQNRTVSGPNGRHTRYSCPTIVRGVALRRYGLQARCSQVREAAGKGAALTQNPQIPCLTVPGNGRGGERVLAHASDTLKPNSAYSTIVGRKIVPVREEIVLRKPFGQLKRFVRVGAGEDAPKLLIVAPMSGHYATLLRGTVERLLPKHDIYITDWRDAKLVPQSDGTFDFDDYIDYLIEFLETIGETSGERPHMLAVCQPAPPAFAATALMAAAKNRWRPGH